MLLDIEKINQIAIQAGKKIMEIYEHEDFSKVVDFKTDHSPLTLADKESHKIIASGLTQLAPDIPVLSEEGKQLPYEERKHWSKFWLVDPLDGTKEFIKRNGEFTVNIALMDQGRPVLGVIYVPATGDLYYGSKESGAFKKDSKGNQTVLKVSSKRSNLIAVGSRSHGSSEEEAILNKYGVKDFISKGSSLKFCMLAEGVADVYFRFGPTMEWDTAAGQAIVEASGGKMYNSIGKDFEYNKVSLKNDSFICLSDIPLVQ
jgi:3'(2'), 5'-bisphosphate nucleotidase